MANLLIAAALSSVSVPAAPPVAHALPDADPAIWVVNDHDTVIYLFGTFHALDGNSEWFNDEVLTAFEASDELVLETIIPDLGQPVPSVSAPQIRGMSVAPTASFLASTRMAINAGRSRGMQVEKGADAVLRQAAEDSGKPVSGLERFEDQLNMFAQLEPSGRRSSAADRKPEGLIGMSTVMGWMQTAWNRGDQKIFTNVVEQMRKTSPATYEMMFAQRNTNWAQWIANRLDRPGTVFMAVGAGHLAGIDSVQAKLSDLGVKSERIN